MAVRPRSKSFGDSLVQGHRRKVSVDTASTKSGGSSGSGGSNGNKDHRSEQKRRARSNSYYRDRSNSHHRRPQSKKDLWKGALEVDIGQGVTVQMIGLDSANRTVYARIDPSCSATPETLASTPLSKVIEVMVDESHRRLAHQILEKKLHVEVDSFPNAEELLRLGSVWLLNETAYASGDSAHARRLSMKDAEDHPEWKDMTLRVHYMPDRFHVAHEYDWSKCSRGLLLNESTVTVGGTKAIVPFGLMPDSKDGVIVYEDKETGFAILNKPGGMPSHSTMSNHAEDVSSMFGAALKQRAGDDSKGHFLSFPIRIEPEMNGLMLASTKKEFCSYMTRQLNQTSAPNKENDPANAENPANNCANKKSPNLAGVTKTYRCLVCIKNPDDIDRVEQLVGQTIEHYVNVQLPAPKKFLSHKTKPNQDLCLLRIVGMGGNSNNLRAACVSSQFNDSSDATLAHRLWGPTALHPAESIGVKFVLQLDVELLTSRPHQLRGQLAAMGLPLVGDKIYGGGSCEMRAHRHMWHRMAVQVCHMSFALPRWEENEDGKHMLVPSGEKKVVSNLNKAWWTSYLDDYERFTIGKK